MANYRSYTHLEKVGKADVDGILNGVVSIQSKIDGTNAVVFNHNGQVYCGSRKRELSETSDNAGFRDYILNSDDVEIAALRQFVLDHENYIIYGEYLGGCDGRKFIGSIKNYLEGGFFIFDVFDVEIGTYLDYAVWEPMIAAFYHRIVPQIALLDHPTEQEVESYLDKCGFNLPDGVLGEGIVIKAQPAFRDVYGNIQIAKIVREEHRENKAKPKKEYTAGEIEQEFVDKYVTAAFMDKCRNKVLQACGADEFDTKNGKMIGMFLNLIVSDAIEEEIYDYIKRKKFPVINFGHLKGSIQSAGRKFLGLV